MKNQKLTPRQWATYNLIKNASSWGDRVTIKDIIDNYPECPSHKDGYKASKVLKPHDPCSAVWGDITAINASPEVEKIIIIDNFTYRLATAEEAEAYYVELREKAMRALVRAYNVKEKMRKDGQGKLISCQDEPINNASMARRFVEAFVGEGEENA